MVQQVPGVRPGGPGSGTTLLGVADGRKLLASCFRMDMYNRYPAMAFISTRDLVKEQQSLVGHQSSRPWASCFAAN